MMRCLELVLFEDLDLSLPPCALQDLELEHLEHCQVAVKQEMLGLEPTYAGPHAGVLCAQAGGRHHLMV